MQFTRLPIPGHPINAEPLTIIVPFVYDMSTNSIEVARDRRDGSYITPTSPLSIISNMLKRFAEYPGNYELVYCFLSIIYIILQYIILTLNSNLLKGAIVSFSQQFVK